VNDSLIKDALYNLHPNSGSDPLYAKGVLVGLVSGLMARSHAKDKFGTVVERIIPLLPDTVMIEAVPESWREVLLKNVRTVSHLDRFN